MIFYQSVNLYNLNLVSMWISRIKLALDVESDLDKLDAWSGQNFWLPIY